MTLKSSDLNIFPGGGIGGKGVLSRHLCPALLPLSPCGGLWEGSHSKTSGWLQAGAGNKRADGMVNPNIPMQRAGRNRPGGAAAGTPGKGSEHDTAWY